MDGRAYQEQHPFNFFALASTLACTVLFIYFTCGWKKRANKEPKPTKNQPTTAAGDWNSDSGSSVDEFKKGQTLQTADPGSHPTSNMPPPELERPSFRKSPVVDEN